MQMPCASFHLEGALHNSQVIVLLQLMLEQRVTSWLHSGNASFHATVAIARYMGIACLLLTTDSMASGGLCCGQHPVSPSAHTVICWVVGLQVPFPGRLYMTGCHICFQGEPMPHFKIVLKSLLNIEKSSEAGQGGCPT